MPSESDTQTDLVAPHQHIDIVDAALRSVTPQARQDLLRGALESFATDGFHAATTRGIATRAGMSPAAVYVHYKSKGQILHILSRLAHETVYGMVTSAVGKTDEPVAQLAGYVHAMALFHARDATIARVSQYELRSLGAPQYREIATIRRDTSAVLDRILKRGISTKEFQVRQPATTARSILSLCIDIARWYDPEGAETPDEIADEYAQISLRIAGATRE
jgi:AcrR family transcriptional regulator